MKRVKNEGALAILRHPLLTTDHWKRASFPLANGKQIYYEILKLDYTSRSAGRDGKRESHDSSM